MKDRAENGPASSKSDLLAAWVLPFVAQTGFYIASYIGMPLNLIALPLSILAGFYFLVRGKRRPYARATFLYIPIMGLLLVAYSLVLGAYVFGHYI